MKKNLLMLLTLVIIVIGVTPFTPGQNPPPKPKLNIAILIFPKAQVIDYSGPMEVFRQFSTSLLPHNTFTVGEKTEAIQTNGPKIVPDYSFSNHPKIDILIIPGGGGEGLLKDQIDDPILIKWIQDNSTDAKYVLSVCNGAIILAKTGLVDGMTVTTTAGLTEKLARDFPNVKVVTDQRYVDNGKFITSAGLSSGIDASLHVIEKLHGKAWAKAVAMNMEYDWRPESNYVRAQLADMKMPGSFYNLVLPSGKFLSNDGGVEEWKEQWSVATEMSAAEFLAKLNSGLITRDKWVPATVTGKGKDAPAQWTFTDKGGRAWNGSATVKPAPSKNELLVTMMVARRRA